MLERLVVAKAVHEHKENRALAHMQWELHTGALTIARAHAIASFAHAAWRDAAIETANAYEVALLLKEKYPEQAKRDPLGVALSASADNNDERG